MKYWERSCGRRFRQGRESRSALFDLVTFVCLGDSVLHAAAPVGQPVLDIRHPLSQIAQQLCVGNALSGNVGSDGSYRRQTARRFREQGLTPR